MKPNKVEISLFHARCEAARAVLASQCDAEAFLREAGLSLFRKSPRTQIVYTLAPKYLYRDYFGAKIYTVWAHRPLGHYDFVWIQVRLRNNRLGL